MAVQRVFLGWDAMPLERAANWLCGHFDEDMGEVLVALPGGRAGRILVEILARKVGPKLKPPTVVTSGVLSDHLLEIEGAPAGRLVRTLAWKEALVRLGAPRLQRIVARPPERGDLAGWMRIAEEVRSLFGEVAAEGLGFADVAKNEVVRAVEGERERWRALAAAQEKMLTLIEREGFVDPHVGRLRAIDAGRDRKVREVVLVGVVEMNVLLKKALDLCESEVTALVFAPESEGERFDRYGGLLPDRWSRWNTSLDAGRQWFVVDSPSDQADRAARVIASWEGRYPAEKISVGLAGREEAPYLRGVLASFGVTTRDAAGTPVDKTRPAMLLQAIGRFLKSERFADLAELVRHPDLEAALRARDTVANPGSELQPVNLVDEYHNEHLPLKADGKWLEKSTNRSNPSLQADMDRLWIALCGILGDLQAGEGRPIADVVPAVRRLLREVYGDRELDPESEEDRILVAGLSGIGAALDELERLPGSFAPEGSVSAAIELLLRSTLGDTIPPAPARAGEPTIELLGWLELALDDAPALVVTGFEDGKVPESVRGHAFLPNQLRRSLGVVDNERRLARDLYSTELLLRSREAVAFVGGRRSMAGDPRVPSRIVFHCDEAEVVPRVKQALRGGRRRVPRDVSDRGRARELPRLDAHGEVERIRVTDFATFLRSPYLFYLQRVVGLDTLDDRERELSPPSFGSLAHRVLERFGRAERIRNEADEKKIERFLATELRALGVAWYGEFPLPAVHLQLEQLEYRLARFARRQAERRRQGWEIREVEWAPAGGGIDLEVDGKPIRVTGRIDRIDHHPDTGRWSLWDYKTGETVKSPVIVHRTTSGEWSDLQLPLYCLLARELTGDDPPAEVGYAAVCRDPAKIGFLGVDDWSRKKGESISLDEGVDGAIETVRAVVRSIRNLEFFTADGFEPTDEILAAIGGTNLVPTGRDAEEGGA